MKELFIITEFLVGKVRKKKSRQSTRNYTCDEIFYFPFLLLSRKKKNVSYWANTHEMKSYITRSLCFCILIYLIYSLNKENFSLLLHSQLMYAKYKNLSWRRSCGWETCCGKRIFCQKLMNSSVFWGAKHCLFFKIPKESKLFDSRKNTFNLPKTIILDKKTSISLYRIHFVAIFRVFNSTEKLLFFKWHFWNKIDI